METHYVPYLKGGGHTVFGPDPFDIWPGDVDTHYIPHLRGGGHIISGADPCGVSVSMALFCLHNIL